MGAVSAIDNETVITESDDIITNQQLEQDVESLSINDDLKEVESINMDEDILSVDDAFNQTDNELISRDGLSDTVYTNNGNSSFNISVNIPEVYEGDYVFAYVNVTPKVNGTVYVDINSVGYYTDVVNGSAVLKCENLPVGNYIAKVSFVNSNTTLLTNVSFKVTAPITISISKSATVYYLDGSTVTARVMSNGVAVSGVVVMFNVDGKTYSVLSDVNGYAKLNLNLAPGTHKVTAAFNNNTASSNVVVKSLLSAKKTTNVKKSAKSTIVKITVKGKTTKVKFTYKGKNKISVNFGNTWKNQKVIVSFKGKTYQVKVNSKGKGALKLTKSVSNKLKKNKKYSTTVFKSYTGKVKVNFNGKNYNVKISKGVANFKVTKKMVKNLKKGKTVKYIVNYNVDKLNRSVKIK